MKKIIIEKTVSGFCVLVDGNQIKTPLGKDIILPTQAIAEEIGREWQIQGDKLRKETMPLTQIACIAIDIVPEKRGELIEDIVSYCDTDVLFYRAGETPELLQLQNDLFEPVTVWAGQFLGIECRITTGIMPVKQNPENRQKMLYAISRYDEWQLAVLASIVKPLSSLILGIAFIEAHIDAEQAFRLSHLEEEYETEKWGEDTEKEARMSRLKQEILAAGQFLRLLL